MIITEFNLHRANGINGLVSFVNLTLNGSLIVNGIKLIQKGDSLCIVTPAITFSQKNTTDKFKDAVYFFGDELNSSLKRLLSDAYIMLLEQESNMVMFLYEKEQYTTMSEQSIEDFAQYNRGTMNPEQYVLPLKPSMLSIRLIDTPKLKAVVELTFENAMVIREVRLVSRFDGNLFVSLPNHKKASQEYTDIVSIINKEFRTKLETMVLQAFMELCEQNYRFGIFNINSDAIDDNWILVIEPSSTLPSQTDFKSTFKPFEYESVDDAMIKTHSILMRASDKGNLRRTDVVPALNRHGVNWREIFNVEDLKGLLKKLPFAIPRTLESTPGKLVDWVIISNDLFGNALSASIVPRNGANTSFGNFEFESIEDAASNIHKILLNASDNGNLRRTNVVPVLNKHGVNWKELFNVDDLKGLLKKLSFATPRTLEPAPGKFVDWVIISNSAFVSTTPTPQTIDKITLAIEVKEKIRDILLCASAVNNGDIIMSDIMPLIQNDISLFNALPKVKLSRILADCEFARQFTVQCESGALQDWVHIYPFGEEDDADDDLAYRHEEFVANNTPPVVIPVPQVKKTDKFPTVLKTEFGRIITAKNNPFRYVENTYLERDDNLKIKRFEKYGARLNRDLIEGIVGAHEIGILTWIASLQYAHKSMLLDLTAGGYIPMPKYKFHADKLTEKINKLYQYGLIDIYKLCAINDTGEILSNVVARTLTITSWCNNMLKDIGRETDYNAFLPIQDGNSVKIRLSTNQWLTRWLVGFKGNINRYFLNRVLIVKAAALHGGRIHAMVECNKQPLFAQSVRRGATWENYWGDFIEKLKRFIVIINNYKNIYHYSLAMDFEKRPILALIGEDEEHCREIYAKVDPLLSNSNFQQPIDIWFTCDIDVFSDFKNSHFIFNTNGERVNVDLAEYIGIAYNTAADKEKSDEEFGEEDSVDKVIIQSVEEIMVSEDEIKDNILV